MTKHKRTAKQLRKNEEKFFNPLRPIPYLMLITRTVDGIIVDVNDCFIHTLGYTREELINHSMTGLQLWADTEERDRFSEALQKQGCVHNHEIHLRLKSGEIILWLLSAEVTNIVAEEPHIIIVASDVTEYKRMEAALEGKRAMLAQRVREQTVDLKNANNELRQSKERYSNLADMLPQTIIETDATGKITFANRRAFQSSGYTQADVDSGLNVLQLIVPEDRDRVMADIERALRGEELRGVEYTALRRDGSTHPVQAYSTTVAREGKPVSLLGVIMDMSEYKQSEAKLLRYRQRLQLLASKSILAEENERRRIAMDLHDSVGQNLSLCKVRLEILQQSLSSTEAAGHVCEALHLVDQAIRDTRSLTFEISSPLLYDLGFGAAIEDLLEYYHEQYGIITKFKDDKQPKPLSSDACIAIFRSVRELLINVVKHAHADRVDVAIWRSNGNVCVRVRDDGIGFEVPIAMQSVGKDGGFGLFSISERFDYLGGRVLIESEPGSGTRVTLEVPLEREVESDKREPK